MKLFSWLVLSWVIQSCFCTSWARDYCIDPQRGNDAAPGTTAKPWATPAMLSKCKLVPGDRVYLRPGDYQQTFAPVGSGTASNPIRIIFAPGTYNFYPKDAQARKFQISNTNDAPNEAKPIALLFENVSYMKVIGTNKTLLQMRGKMIQVALVGAKQIEFSSLAFDYKRPTMSEYTVVSVQGNTAEIAIHSDSAYRLEGENRLIWVGEGWELKAPQFAQEGVPAEGILYRASSPFGRTQKIEQLAQGQLKLTFNGNANLTPGHVFQERNTRRDMVGVFASESKNIVWRKCNFYYIHGMGMVNQFCENLTYDTVNFAPHKGRTASCWADSIQVSSCKGKVIINKCTFDGTHDDPLNVHGTALRIIQQVGPKQIRARFMHNQTYGFQPFYPGDSIAFVDNESMRATATCKVVQVKMEDTRNVLLTFQDNVPSFKQNYVIDNLTWQPSVDINACLIRMCSTRGFLLTTGKPVRVRNTTFHRTFMSAILVEGDANGWFESGQIRDMLVSNNTFFECNEPVININPGTRTNRPGEAVEENIRITENTFVLKGERAVFAKSVKGLIISKNKYSPSKASAPVRTQACEEVSIQ